MLEWLKRIFLKPIDKVDDMIPPVLMTMAANFVMDLVKDKAQSLASEHIEKAPMVAELAKKYRFNFSPRLHLLVWDMALKV